MTQLELPKLEASELEKARMMLRDAVIELDKARRSNLYLISLLTKISDVLGD